MKKRPYWRDDRTWVCPNHLPSARIPASCATCWFSNCSSERPERSTKPTKLYFVKPLPEKTVDACYWKDCNKGEGGRPAKRRERSKYCSTDCKNRNARWRYKMKKKGIKIPAA